jgi:ATP-binding cassette subfamily F protein uup
MELDPNNTLKEALCPHGDSVVVDGNVLHVVSWAERFLFSPSQLSSRVSSLSGGEKARVLVARIMTQNANVLVLDEPTNDLDVWMLEELEEALAAFSGALVIVSHDRRFLETLCDSYVALPGYGQDTLVTYFASYEQWIQAKVITEKDYTVEPQASAVNASTNLPKARPSKGPSYKQKKDFEECEAAIAKCEEQIKLLERALQEPSVASNPSELMRLSEELQSANQHLIELVDTWETLAEVIL